MVETEKHETVGTEAVAPGKANTCLCFRTMVLATSCHISEGSWLQNNADNM